MTELVGGDDFHHRAAALLRAASNDLKRDDAGAAADLGMSTEEFREFTTGARRLTWEIVSGAARVWPVNERDLLPVHDDVALGVTVCTAAESAATSRMLTRGDVAYYEYRDTAMSRLASFRPERIRMLQVVDDDDPYNDAVEWNEGHLLYQFTYFVGPVNYYYRWRGRQHCVRMETGDSVWGVPFAPHSFTARAAEDAYILALTYGGELVGDAQRELAVLGPNVAAYLAIDTAAASPLRSVIQSLMTGRLMVEADVADSADLTRGRLGALCAGAEEPTWDELQSLARALGVSVRDLLPRSSATTDGVSVQRHDTARSWRYPSRDDAAYAVTRLAGDPSHSETTAVELSLLDRAIRDEAVLVTHQHSYAYVLDGGPVTIVWDHASGQHERELGPGDSVYIAPGVAAAFARAGPGESSLLLLRVGGPVTMDVRFALGTLDERGLRRYLAEDRLWYDPAGHRGSAGH